MATTTDTTAPVSWPLCATCGRENRTVFIGGTPIKRDECSRCYRRRTETRTERAARRARLAALHASALDPNHGDDR